MSPDSRMNHKRSVSIKSQIRLYGEPFGEDAEGKVSGRRRSQRDPQLLELAKYVMHEKDHMGDFSLLYPADEYSDQPTRGKCELYADLLSLSMMLHSAGMR